MQAQPKTLKIQRSQCILLAGYMCAATMVALLVATLLSAAPQALLSLCVVGFGAAIISAFVGDIYGK